MKLTRFSHYYLHREPFDREHKAIYDSLVALLRGRKENYPKLLSDVAEAVDDHFATEHKIMVASGYPFLDSHEEIHEEIAMLFIATLNDPTPEKIENLINEHLHHIDWHDRPLVEWLDSQEISSKKKVKVA